jgi:hypothetical protein
MPIEPSTKRAIAFFDGNGLFQSVKECFGYTYPNYNVGKLARLICEMQNWSIGEVRFYVGVPDPKGEFRKFAFWKKKLDAMARDGVTNVVRGLRYVMERATLPDGRNTTVRIGHEVGITVRIALDVMHAVQAGKCDVVLLFSQNQDLAEVAEQVRIIARENNRWIKIASAFPEHPSPRKRRGVDKTDWIRITQRVYDQCLDGRDKRPIATDAGKELTVSRKIAFRDDVHDLDARVDAPEENDARLDDESLESEIADFDFLHPDSDDR